MLYPSIAIVKQGMCTALIASLAKDKCFNTSLVHSIHHPTILQHLNIYHKCGFNTLFYSNSSHRECGMFIVLARFDTTLFFKIIIEKTQQFENHLLCFLHNHHQDNTAIQKNQMYFLNNNIKITQKL